MSDEILQKVSDQYFFSNSNWFIIVKLAIIHEQEILILCVVPFLNKISLVKSLCLLSSALHKVLYDGCKFFLVLAFLEHFIETSGFN